MLGTGVTNTIKATTEPVSVEDAKTHLRVDSDVDTAYIGTLVSSTRRWAERFTRRAFNTQTWTVTFDRFPTGDILLPFPPLQSVSSITYVDNNGDTQTWSDSEYGVNTASLPGRVQLGYSESYPDTRSQPNAVTVTLVAGYGDADTDVPDDIRHALKILVAHFYEQRELVITGTIVAKVPQSAMSLLWSYRVMEGAP